MELQVLWVVLEEQQRGWVLHLVVVHILILLGEVLVSEEVLEVLCYGELEPEEVLEALYYGGLEPVLPHELELVSLLDAPLELELVSLGDVLLELVSLVDV